MTCTGLKHKIWIFSGALLAIIAPSSLLLSQSVVPVKKLRNYLAATQQDSSHTMLELKRIIPDIVYDLRYATDENFTKTKLYAQKEQTFLRLPAARALANVQQALKENGLGIKIFDAYRPYSATKKMWELIKDERYVANPAKGSGHNRGIAVDLTIIELGTGKELDMGTGFDHFSDTAHHSFSVLSDEVQKNRRLLKETMMQYGFQPLETEWWHYSWPNNRNYEVLDLSFRALSKVPY